MQVIPVRLHMFADAVKQCSTLAECKQWDAERQTACQIYCEALTFSPSCTNAVPLPSFGDDAVTEVTEVWTKGCQAKETLCEGRARVRKGESAAQAHCLGASLITSCGHLRSLQDISNEPDICDDTYLLAGRGLSYCPAILLTSRILPTLLDSAIAGILVQHR